MTLPGALFCNTYACAMNDGESTALPSHSMYMAMPESNARAPTRSIFHCATIALGAASTFVLGTIVLLATPLSLMTHAQTDMHVVSTPSVGTKTMPAITLSGPLQGIRASTINGLEQPFKVTPLLEKRVLPPQLIQSRTTERGSRPEASNTLVWSFGIVAAAASMAMVISRWLVGRTARSQEAKPLAMFTVTGVQSMNTLPTFAVDPNGPYPSGRYDPQTAAAYFAKRPLTVLSRGAAITGKALGFGVAVLFDYQSGPEKVKKNQPQRAKELAELLTRLGPTFIKVGQALSIRSDLLPPAYLEGLATLQDSVPPFPSDQALRRIAEELGVVRVSDVFAELTPEPIASASLGQVYKGKLVPALGGREVAVKVQRPDMIETVALDMHLLRVAAPLVVKVLNLNSDLPGVVDAWGFGFVDELDYRREANNAADFMTKIAKTPLRSAVFAPAAIPELVTSRILTTEWVNGERLELSSAKDVTQLCSVAMNTYLTMMLETGTLHADPHPGNLLRSTDGRLCILDWGLVTEIPQNLQLSFIEHIAHLTSRDYAKVPEDLVKLGFVPAGLEDTVRSSGTVEVLTTIYSTWAGGGGASNGNVATVVKEIRGLSEKYGGYIFQVPPYFAYIAKAFATLEGIGLSNDPKYAVVGECLPYISQRLLTDPDSRVSGALNTFVYGPSKDSPDKAVDVDRIEFLTSGFASYTQATGGLSDGQGGIVNLGGPGFSADDVEKSVKQLSDLLLRPDPAATPLQEIVEDEIARLIGAGTRTAAATIRESPAGQLVSFVLDPFGLAKPYTHGPLFTPDTKDAVVLASGARIAAVAEKPTRQALETLISLPPDEQTKAAQAVIRVLWEKRDGATLSVQRLARKLYQQAETKFEQSQAVEIR